MEHACVCKGTCEDVFESYENNDTAVLTSTAWQWSDGGDQLTAIRYAIYWRLNPIRTDQGFSTKSTAITATIYYRISVPISSANLKGSG